MIIDLKTIAAGTRSFSFSLEKNWWHSKEQGDALLGFSSPVKVTTDICRAGERYVLEGNLSGMLEVACDRCLEPYRIDLSHEFRIILALPPQEIEKDEVELLEEDMEIGFITDDQLNLDEVVKEQIYLALPVKKLCSEDCPGLCPECGANLNNGDCGCAGVKGHPAFSKLKNLKIEGV